MPNDVLAEREKTHGDFTAVSAVYQYILSAFSHGPNYQGMTPRQRTALDMIAMKQARILCGDPSFPDHWEDISGYARLGGQIVDAA